MRFKTLSEYDDEIKKIDEILDNFKEHIEKCPEDSGTKTNYQSLKYIRDELKKERDTLAMSLYHETYQKEKEDLEFYKATREAFDRCDDSKKGMSVEEFLKELDSW